MFNTGLWLPMLVAGALWPAANAAADPPKAPLDNLAQFGSFKAPGQPSGQAASPMPTQNPAAGPAVRAPAPQATGQPLSMMAITVAPPLCKSIPAAANAFLEKKTATDLAMTQVHGGPSGISFPIGKFKSYFLPSVEAGCCAKSVSFSVQDQQLAGCSGGDSVAACMDKLTRHCIAKHVKGYKVREELQATASSASNLSARAGEFAQGTQDLLKLLP